jgi:hypothetical protein
MELVYEYVLPWNQCVQAGIHNKNECICKSVRHYSKDTFVRKLIFHTAQEVFFGAQYNVRSCMVNDRLSLIFYNIKLPTEVFNFFGHNNFPLYVSTAWLQKTLCYNSPHYEITFKDTYKDQRQEKTRIPRAHVHSGWSQDSQLPSSQGA